MAVLFKGTAVPILPTPLYNFWRRLFGRYELDDPRPIAREAPYTYFVPPEEEAAALAPGDLVKLLFRSIPASRKWGAERMWVKVQEVRGRQLIGTLDNDPTDMPQLRCGAVVAFQRHHVINIQWADESRAARFRGRPEKQVWDRCLVDTCVLEGTPVEYLYREEPDLGRAEDKFPDSGWRIRGREAAGDDMDARETQYLAMGVVLNRDDSWVHLIDAPVGSAFMRNFATGEYEPARQG